MPAKVKSEDFQKYVDQNHVHLIPGGRSFFDLMKQLIEESKEIIHLQTYIFVEDETGQMIIDALKQAAKRKVKIYFLIDGYASQGVSSEFIEDLTNCGINFRFFEPLFRSKYYYFGRRLHHKILVVDTQHALVGGINISNNYNDFPNKPAWFDFAIHAEGEIVLQLCTLCWKTWLGFPRQIARIPCDAKPGNINKSSSEPTSVRMRRNDWVRKKNEVSKSYFELFQNASHDILLISSYFLPGNKFKKSLTDAVKRGVRVRIVLAGISDVPVAKQAERHMYRWLFKNNIEIYEFNPTILHAKLAVCDSKWLTIGSYNLNNISAFASIELNLDIKNEAFVRSTLNLLDITILEKCTRITESQFKAKNHFFQRVLQELSYQTIRILLFVFTFYFKQQE